MNHEGIWSEYRPTYMDGWGAYKRVGDLVRCRDCERWSNEPPNYREEPQWCGRFACHAEPDGFCKWGKARSEQ